MQLRGVRGYFRGLYAHLTGLVRTDRGLGSLLATALAGLPRTRHAEDFDLEPSASQPLTDQEKEAGAAGRHLSRDSAAQPAAQLVPPVVVAPPVATGDGDAAQRIESLLEQLRGVKMQGYKTEAQHARLLRGLAPAAEAILEVRGTSHAPPPPRPPSQPLWLPGAPT